MSHKPQYGKLTKAVTVLLFLIYICSLIYFLFFAEEYGRTEVAENFRYNLEPFKEIKRYWNYRDIIGYKMVIINLVGNVAVFIPFGFMLPIIYEPLRKWYALLPVALLFSGMIEFAQLVTRVGTMDVDDVILNVTGAMIGLVLLCVISHSRRKKNERKS